MKAKWDKLKIKVASGLVQHIILPDFGIDETQRRASHFVDDETPFIVIDDDTNVNTAKVLISSHLAKYFDSPASESDIFVILVLPKEDLEELLKTKMDLPALPRSWSRSFESETSPADVVENTDLAENMGLLQISSAENSIARALFDKLRDHTRH